MRVQPEQKQNNFLRKKMAWLTDLIRQTIHSKRKPPYMEAIAEKLTMNMPIYPFSQLHQKFVSDTYLINQSLQIIAFNTSSYSNIHIVLPWNSLQFTAN